MNQNGILASQTQNAVILQQGVRRLTAILILLGVAFCFFASSICITIVLAAFLAILVEPAVRMLERVLIPRFFGAAFVILVGVLTVGGLAYLSYGKLADFSDQFPLYVSRISDAVSPISNKIARVQDSAGKFERDVGPKKVPEIRVRESTPWASYLVRGVGSVSGAVVIAAVVPFLMFFMLLVHDKIYFSLKTTFEKRVDVDKLADRVTGMVRSYVAGNLVIGAILSATSMLVFWQMGLTPAVTLGVISGMFNLIPFLGIIVALFVPLIAGVFQLHGAAPFIAIAVTVTALHLLAANFLIPRFVGSRLDVGPVAATVGILFWGWLWGVPGILLAVPLTAFIKLLADSNPSCAHLSNLLAREPRRFIFRRRPTASPEALCPRDPL
ncbi:MAG TPA: AI-2E family transporter [Candidatus Acidoferrum sp.]